MFLEFNTDGPRGGHPFGDGPDGAASPIGNMANTPIESIEANHPLLITRYGYVPDSEGAGKYRGGLGMVREYQVTAEEAMIQIRSDRAQVPAVGHPGRWAGQPHTQHPKP